MCPLGTSESSGHISQRFAVMTEVVSAAVSNILRRPCGTGRLRRRLTE
jgi:hypothetical protein